MENFVQTVYQNLLNEIETLPKVKNMGVKNPTMVGNCVRICIGGLKDYFKSNPFTNKEQEVRFFKYEKPAIVAEYIYAQELYILESNRPFGEPQLTHNYYIEELGAIRKGFGQYRYLYQYFQLDGNEFDEMYFCRGNRADMATLPVTPDLDPEFSTPADYLFAKFIAMERLQDFIINLEYSQSERTVSSVTPALQWTGDKINLVELAYGLYDTAQVGDGETSIAEIVAWLEQSFGLKLSRYFQMFSEIKRRKSVSKSRFLEHMAEMLNRHIDDGDAFRPQKPKPVSGSRSAVKG